MQSNGHAFPWRTLLLLFLLVTSALLSILSALVLALVGIVEYSHDAALSLRAFSLGSSLAFLGLLLVPPIFYGLRKMLGYPERGVKLNLPLWLLIPIALLWIGSLLLGQWLIGQKGLISLLFPPLGIPAAALPVGMLILIAVADIPLGPRWRAWGAFGLGMTVAPFVLVLIELTLFAAIGAVLVLYLAVAHPEVLSALLEAVNSPIVSVDLLTEHLAPYLLQPTVLIGSLFVVAGIVPVLEELIKPVGLWLFAARLETPSQGFALGALSGAGYALVESLPIASEIDNTWGGVLFARFGTSLMHILSSGLVGWGFLKARQSHRKRYLLGGYGLAVTLHGTWNAISVLAVTGALTEIREEVIASPDRTIAAIAALGLLMIVLLLVLRKINRRLRSEPSPAETPPQ